MAAASAHPRRVRAADAAQEIRDRVDSWIQQFTKYDPRGRADKAREELTQLMNEVETV